MFMINVLDLAQPCVGIFLIRLVARNLLWGDCYGGVGRNLQLSKARNLGAELPALENFVFFWKINLIFGLLKEIEISNAKTWLY